MVWSDMEQLAKTANHVAAFIHIAEADDSTLADAVHHYIGLRASLEQLKDDLPQNLAKKVLAATDNRDSLFFKEWPCLAYLLHPQYRGEYLGGQRLRATIDFMFGTVCMHQNFFGSFIIYFSGLANCHG